MIHGRWVRSGAGSILLVLVSGVCAPAWSQPVISSVTGLLQVGSRLTVNGSGFGLKPVAAPLKWDNFEQGSNGTQLSNWTLDGVLPVFSNIVRRANSTMSARANFINNRWDSSFGVTGSFPRIYLDIWYYYDGANPLSRNHKPFRIHTNTYAPNMYFGMWCSAANGSILGQDGIASGNPGGWLTYPPFDSDYFNKKWSHIQLYLEQSSPGGNDGTAVFVIDGVTGLNLVRNLSTRNTPDQYWDTIWIGNYLGHDADGTCAASGDAYTYWDNAYIDTTRAHVEIGNASTYNACTLREIQIPTVWTPTLLEVSFNQGAITDLSNAYLYVVDRNGAVNTNGYRLCTSCPNPVGDTVPPSAPTDLRARSGP